MTTITTIAECQDAIRAVHAMQCRSCGAEKLFDLDAALELCQDPDNWTFNIPVVEVFSTPKAQMCEACLQKHMQLTEEGRMYAEREIRVREITSHLQRHGLYLPTSISETFIASDGNRMSLNRDAFGVGQNWTVDGPCLWIHGNRGTGKTYLAHATLNRVLAQGKSVGEVSAVSLSSIGSTWEREGWVKLRTDLDALLIDDIDKLPHSTFALELLWQIMDVRNKHKRPTIATSNGDPMAFREYCKTISNTNPSLVETLMDRFNWPGKKCQRLELQGESMRR